MSRQEAFRRSAIPGPIATSSGESLRSDLCELVGKTVEDTLNGLLEAKALAVAEELERMRLGEAARVVREGFSETLAYTGFPRERWRRIRTNNAIERLNREIRRRTRVVGTFPDGKSALLLITARLKYVAESGWGSRRYLDVTLLDE